MDTSSAGEFKEESSSESDDEFSFLFRSKQIKSYATAGKELSAVLRAESYSSPSTFQDNDIKQIRSDLLRLMDMGPVEYGRQKLDELKLKFKKVLDQHPRSKVVEKSFSEWANIYNRLKTLLHQNSQWDVACYWEVGLRKIEDKRQWFIILDEEARDKIKIKMGVVDIREWDEIAMCKHYCYIPSKFVQNKKNNEENSNIKLFNIPPNWRKIIHGNDEKRRAEWRPSNYDRSKKPDDKSLSSASSNCGKKTVDKSLSSTSSECGKKPDDKSLYSKYASSLPSSSKPDPADKSLSSKTWDSPPSNNKKDIDDKSLFSKSWNSPSSHSKTETDDKSLSSVYSSKWEVGMSEKGRKRNGSKESSLESKRVCDSLVHQLSTLEQKHYDKIDNIDQEIGNLRRMLTDMHDRRLNEFEEFKRRKDSLKDDLYREREQEKIRRREEEKKEEKKRYDEAAEEAILAGMRERMKDVDKRKVQDLKNKEDQRDIIIKKFKDELNRIPEGRKTGRGFTLYKIKSWKSTRANMWPQEPIFMGGENSWCREESSFIEESIPDDVAMTANDMVEQAINEEMECKVASIEEYENTLGRLAAKISMAATQLSFSAKDQHVEEKMKWKVRQQTVTEKRNDLAFYIKNRAKEFTRAVPKHLKGVKLLLGDRFEQNEETIKYELDILLTRLWWFVNLSEGVSRIGYK